MMWVLVFGEGVVMVYCMVWCGVGGRLISIVPKKSESEAGNPHLEANLRTLVFEFDPRTQPISVLRLPLESPCDPLQC